MRRRIERLEQKLAKLEERPPTRFRLLLRDEDGQFIDLETGERTEPSAAQRIVLDWDDGEPEADLD